MVGIAQLVRALGCGPRGRRFKSGYSPHLLKTVLPKAVIIEKQVNRTTNTTNETLPSDMVVFFLSYQKV